MPLITRTKNKTVDLGDHHIAFGEGPHNGPPLVLVHGVTGRRDSFLEVMPALTEDFHVFAIDQRGHGFSSHTPGHYKLSDYSSDLIGFLDIVLSEPAIVWGHSLGAGVTLDAVGNAPRLFRGVVLEDPPLGQSMSRRALHEIYKIWLKLADSELSVDEIEQQLVSMDLQAAGATAHYKAETLHQLDPDMLRSTINRNTWAGFDFKKAINLVDRPALLAQADPDRGGIIPDELLDSLAPLPETFTVKKFPGIGHTIHRDAPEEMVKAVREFVSGI